MVEIRKIKKEKEFSMLLKFLSSLYPNQPTEQIEKNANMPKIDNIVVAVDKGGKIIGSCWCVDLKFGIYRIGGIGGLAVDINYRKQQLGQNLVKYIIEELAIYETYLAWTRVVEFFEKLNFKNFSEGIETINGDSTPMILTKDEFLLKNNMKIKWNRIKF